MGKSFGHNSVTYLLPNLSAASGCRVAPRVELSGDVIRICPTRTRSYARALAPREQVSVLQHESVDRRLLVEKHLRLNLPAVPSERPSSSTVPATANDADRRPQSNSLGIEYEEYSNSLYRVVYAWRCNQLSQISQPRGSKVHHTHSPR